jgi:hypothetical protein
MIDPMWILLLEAGVALALLVIIVWWTRPQKKDNEKKDNEPR